VINVVGATRIINYGLNKVRFPAPVERDEQRGVIGAVLAADGAVGREAAEAGLLEVIERRRRAIDDAVVRAVDGHQRPVVCANLDCGFRSLLDVAREKRDRPLRISASGITTSATSWLRISSAGSASCAPRDRE
jgi:hypothetical protein